MAVHGSYRVAEGYRDAFAALAEQLGAVVLAPLFPCGVEGPEDTESYKFCVTSDTRFDHVLLAMIDELNERLDGRVATGRFALFGYSGGGQFVHRFAYLHAHRLAALSIGAPGKVTLMDETLPWWKGLRGLAELAGQPLRLDALRALPVQMVIGDLDDKEDDVATAVGSPHWMDGINDAGRNRTTLMESLRRSLAADGVSARLDVVEGVAHDGFAVLAPVQAFLADVLVKEARR
ncbi:hypothetical protein NA2_13000 [Nitratireductor pacificus pht-3B]|uniref:Poly(Aspartic acid) hydrolase n=1 Tax=Nitratireductor pacificus pht-3B TaxID=391937 RepID=K2MBR1_9HYPH|nr:hypothetical protein NA2_13000 [Nitratireductor pacificus pht-3B]